MSWSDEDWADLVDEQAEVIDTRTKERDWYKFRVEMLQAAQARMRDPERTIVCDIIANAARLPDPDGKRYGGEKGKPLVRPQRFATFGGKAYRFIAHIQAHLAPGEEVVCKICGKTAREICEEGGE